MRDHVRDLADQGDRDLRCTPRRRAPPRDEHRHPGPRDARAPPSSRNSSSPGFCSADGVQHPRGGLGHPGGARGRGAGAASRSWSTMPPTRVTSIRLAELAAGVEAPGRGQTGVGSSTPSRSTSIAGVGGAGPAPDGVVPFPAIERPRLRAALGAPASTSSSAHRGVGSPRVGVRRRRPARRASAPTRIRAPLNTGPSTQARTFHHPGPSCATTGTAHVQHTPSPQAIISSTATWHGMRARRAELGDGPQHRVRPARVDDLGGRCSAITAGRTSVTVPVLPQRAVLGGDRRSPWPGACPRSA